MRLTLLTSCPCINPPCDDVFEQPTTGIRYHRKHKCYCTNHIKLFHEKPALKKGGKARVPKICIGMCPSASPQILAPVQLATNCTTPCTLCPPSTSPLCPTPPQTHLATHTCKKLALLQLGLNLLKNVLQEYLGLSICSLWKAGDEVSHLQDFTLSSCL